MDVIPHTLCTLRRSSFLPSPCSSAFSSGLTVHSYSVLPLTTVWDACSFPVSCRCSGIHPGYIPASRAADKTIQSPADAWQARFLPFLVDLQLVKNHQHFPTGILCQSLHAIDQDIHIDRFLRDDKAQQAFIGYSGEHAQFQPLCLHFQYRPLPHRHSFSDVVRGVPQGGLLISIDFRILSFRLLCDSGVFLLQSRLYPLGDLLAHPLHRPLDTECLSGTIGPQRA